MSDDEENSDLDLNDSDDDASLLSNTPPKKQKKAPAPKKKAAGAPLQEVDNESFAMEGAMDVDGASDIMVVPKPKKSTATEQYQKVRKMRSRMFLSYADIVAAHATRAHH